MTNIKKLETIGHELFGPNWITPVTRMFEINKSMIRRWLTSQARPSVTIADELLGTIEKFREALALACADRGSGNEVGTDMTERIVGCYEYADVQERKSAIDVESIALFEKTVKCGMNRVTRATIIRPVLAGRRFH